MEAEMGLPKAALLELGATAPALELLAFEGVGVDLAPELNEVPAEEPLLQP